MQRGVLCLLSVGEADMGIRDLTSNVVLEVRFTVEVGERQSPKQVALVEQVGKAHFGLAGHLKICCAPIDFGIPLHVIEPHIEAYVMRAVHIVGGVTLAEMAKKIVEMEMRVPIEFEVGTGAIH